MNSSAPYSTLQKTLAWSVHLFTASGICAAFMAILAIADHQWVNAFWWLILCLIIDGIDGTFARLFKAKEVLPKMNGTNIDYVIDFATYAIIPAYFFYEAQLVNDEYNLILTFLILMVSAIYYGKVGMVSEDNYFIGFPVMWNMAIFFMFFVFHVSPLLNGIYIVFLAVLHFIPIKFVYPSRASKQFWTTLIATINFFVAIIMVLLNYPETTIWNYLAGLSVLYYGLVAIYNTWIE